MRSTNLKRLRDRIDALVNGQVSHAIWLRDVVEAVKQDAIEKGLTVDEAFEIALEAGQGAEEGEA